MSGIKGAPWWAMWISGLCVQAAIAAGQYFVHVEGGDFWGHTVGFLAQGVVGVAMVYGPSSAARLARSVGDAVQTGRGENKEEPKP